MTLRPIPDHAYHAASDDELRSTIWAVETSTDDLNAACRILHWRNHRVVPLRPGDYAAILADEEGIDYSTALVMCNMD